MTFSKENAIREYAKAQKAGCVLPCPRCGNHSMKESATENALSRRADIYICNDCGMQEAFEDSDIVRQVEKPLDDWFAIRHLFATQCTESIDNKGYVVNISTEQYISKQDIDDIMVCALEGGINYWCSEAVVDGDYLGDYASDQISRGGELKLYDAEDDKVYVLDLQKFLNGFALAWKNGFAGEWLDNYGNIDCCNIDAHDADVIVQYALFGEVVYG